MNVKCDCCDRCSIVNLEFRPREEDCHLSIYRKYEKQNKLRQILNIIRTGTPYEDDVILTFKDSEKIINYIEHYREFIGLKNTIERLLGMPDEKEKEKYIKEFCEGILAKNKLAYNYMFFKYLKEAKSKKFCEEFVKSVPKDILLNVLSITDIKEFM